MPEAPATRVTLLIRIRDAHDVEAWRHFVKLYGPVVYGWCRKRGLQDADACDLTQEVLRAVTVGAPRLEYDPQRGTFRSWLFKIARRKLHDFLEQRRRLPRPSDGSSWDLIASDPAGDEQAQWERDYQNRLFSMAAEKVRSRVDDSTWQAFWMTAVEGQSGQQAADALGLTIGAVYVAKSRVLARLKQQVERFQGDE